MGLMPKRKDFSVDADEDVEAAVEPRPIQASLEATFTNDTPGDNRRCVHRDVVFRCRMRSKRGG